jgi:hypothetical protein
MDPETAKLVAIIAGAFTVLGAAVSQIGAALVARYNMATQRATARDNARRERRERQVNALLTIANARANDWHLFQMATAEGDEAKAREVAERLVLERSPYTEVAWRAVSSPQFIAAAEAFIKADRTLGLGIVAAHEAKQSLDGEEIAQLREILEDSIIALNQAAERYIDGD